VTTVSRYSCGVWNEVIMDSAAALRLQLERTTFDQYQNPEPEVQPRQK